MEAGPPGALSGQPVARIFGAPAVRAVQTSASLSRSFFYLLSPRVQHRLRLCRRTPARLPETHLHLLVSLPPPPPMLLLLLLSPPCRRRDARDNDLRPRQRAPHWGYGRRGRGAMRRGAPTTEGMHRPALALRYLTYVCKCMPYALRPGCRLRTGLRMVSRVGGCAKIVTPNWRGW